MALRIWRFLPVVALLAMSTAAAAEPARLLVVSVTFGFRHGSIGTVRVPADAGIRSKAIPVSRSQRTFSRR